jgi:hypothetical protein
LRTTQTLSIATAVETEIWATFIIYYFFKNEYFNHSSYKKYIIRNLCEIFFQTKLMKIIFLNHLIFGKIIISLITRTLILGYNLICLLRTCT